MSMSALKSLCDRMRATVRAPGSCAYLSLDQSEVSIVVEAVKKSSTGRTKAKPKAAPKAKSTTAKAATAAKPVAKRVTVKKPRAKKTMPVAGPDERRRMIAEAAYYKAQARGFGGGDEVADWLAAEAEVDALGAA
jgi:hypothetical protein